MTLAISFSTKDVIVLCRGVWLYARRSRAGGLEFVGIRRPWNISAANAGRIAIRPYLVMVSGNFHWTGLY